MSLLAVLAAAATGALPVPVAAGTQIEGTAIAVEISSSGDERGVELKLTDAVSGAPLRNAEPLGWLYPEDAALSCKAVIVKASNGALGTPGINLNTLRIAAAFADGSLGMIDPQTSFAGTQLESAYDLGSPASTMAASVTGDRLAVITEAGKLQLIDASAAMRAVFSIPAPADAAVGWDGNRLIMAGGKGIVTFSGEAGAPVLTRDWQMTGQPLLRIAPGQSLLLSSASGPVGIGAGATMELSKLPGISGARDAVWLAKSAAWAIAASDGKLFLGRAGSLAEVLHDVSGVRAVASDDEGRFILAAVDEGANLALIDAADGRVLDTRPIPERADRITVSRDFAYVYSGTSANVILISFVVIRQQQRISTVDLPFGSDQPAAQTSFGRVGIMPGGAAVVGQDGKTLFAYAEGMMVPMGSFAGISRTVAGVAVLDRSMRETAPGVYRTTTEVRFGGRYRVPLRLGNPRLDTCLTVDLPGPERKTQAVASNARFDRREISASAKQPVAVAFAAPVSAPTIVALATDMLGRWQRHFPLRRTGPGKYMGEVSFPAPGSYRLIALDARSSVSVQQEPIP